MASRFSFNSSSSSEQSPHANRSAGTKRRSSDANSDGYQLPLTTNKLSNTQEHHGRMGSAKKQKSSDNDIMNALMKQLQDSEVAKQTTSTMKPPKHMPYRHPHAQDKTSSSGSNPATPASIRMTRNSDSSSDVSNVMDSSTATEFAKLKQQLAVRDQQLALMQQELVQTRSVVSTLPQVEDDPSEVYIRGGRDLSYHNVSDGIISGQQDAFNTAARPLGLDHHNAWDSNEGEKPTENGPAIAMMPGRNMWSSQTTGGGVMLEAMAGHNGSLPISAPVPQRQMAAPLRIDTARTINGYGTIGQPTPMTGRDIAAMQASARSRPGSAVDPRFMAYDAFGMGSPALSMNSGLSPPMTPMPFGSNVGMFPPPNQYIPRPIGTRPSPPGSDYNSAMTGPWNNHNPIDGMEPTYIPPVEPLNYRRLLDRNASCNWEYIVDKIIHNNDQQASIFLQQKLKQATPEHKYQIIQCIINKAYALMINRFGNFLVQRCFEHGTQEQIIAIANAIRGNTLQLSMDAFGCHVVQKAFDVVPEEYKAMMVHELLRQIPQTVCHRYSCHVWQKLFELRWSDSPPQIMKYVNEALSGMWHTVALGETGSLVVQNIFENCLEEDKRPCIDECLNSIDNISRGQFGNWCIQHICEHGAVRDRTWAVDHILRHAQEYSTDQYASKVVEKCLKIGGDDFMDRYLDCVCEARSDRPRQAIIDIAGDQYGNYLVQWILANASLQHREIVSVHVRKHMVSLRGSKYGSRVAMLCCNPQSATRPGVPAGFQLNRYNSNTSSNSSMSNGMANNASAMGNSRTPYSNIFR